MSRDILTFMTDFKTSDQMLGEAQKVKRDLVFGDRSKISYFAVSMESIYNLSPLSTSSKSWELIYIKFWLLLIERRILGG